MAVGAVGVVVGIIVGAAGGILTHKSYERKRESSSEAADKATRDAAAYGKEVKLRQSQLKKKYDEEIRLKGVSTELAKESAETVTEHDKEILEKRAARLESAAIADFSASGTNPYAGGSSSEAVLRRMESEEKEEETWLETKLSLYESKLDVEFDQYKSVRATSYSQYKTLTDLQNVKAQADYKRLREHYEGEETYYQDVGYHYAAMAGWQGFMGGGGTTPSGDTAPSTPTKTSSAPTSVASGTTTGGGEGYGSFESYYGGSGSKGLTIN